VVKKRRSPNKHSQISKVEKQYLDRFGCVLRERTGVIYIDWPGIGGNQVTNAEIFARLVYLKSDRGPIVFLAYEISPIRPLPRYCYFPFDLRKEVHRDYLSRFAETGEIRFRFLADKNTFDLTYQLTPYLRRSTSELFAEILQDWGAYERDKYDFEAALQLLERYVRMPILLDRVLLEDNLSEIALKAREAIKMVPNENRELAKRIVREAAEAFVPYYQNHGKTLFEKFFSISLGLACISDLRRMFADNPAGLTEFLSNGLAATFSQKELEGLSDLVILVLSILKLPFKEEVKEQFLLPTETSSMMPELPTGLASLVQSMVFSGIPKDATSRVFELLGLEVGGKPGRPVKDYSREYELKASGDSWTDVARHALQKNDDLRAEFGGRDFDSLDRIQQEALRNRIREGVRSYAEREGKPFPLKPGDSSLVPAKGEQEKP
jgi:hypothetical protein